MKAVISVIGKDRVGILSKVCGICAEHNVNVVEVTQSILEDLLYHDYGGGYFRHDVQIV